MADTKLYKVAITPCGKYVHGTEYDRLCLVLNATEDGGDGCSYVSLQKNKNVRPGTDDSIWALSLERGEQGERGPSGSGFSDVEITVSDTTGTPSGTAVIANDTLYLSFSGMKGSPGEIDEEQLQGIEDQIAAKQDALVSGTNIKTIGNQSILGSGNIQVGDENAVKFVSQSLTDSQKTQARSNIGAGTYSKAGLGIPKSDLSSEVQTSLGKADTAIQDISGKQDVITDLATIRSGAAAGATAYQKPGSGIPKTDLASGVQGSLDLADSALQYTPSGEIDPEITPADYATQAEVSQLEAKVNNLANTRYYGIFTSSADLPADASENGYAYVGSSTPLAIYEFDGEDWNDTGVTVNSIQGEPGADGVGFASVESPTPADGTVTITLSNGDTMVLDLNHNHPQYLKYVMLESESDMPASPDSTTLYLWPETE